MKKSTPFVLAIALFFLINSCEPEGDLARLNILNRLNEDIVELSLSGEETTGNLLSDSLGSGDSKTDIAELIPGVYTWTAKDKNDKKYESDGQIELFPGRNNLVIE